ncbi:helix-turn-helix transcriptional regulator [Virgibacillus halodenitrificans]|uniref:helix-turn-helix transcriptional regulator n=1 Tax=Virgibacillus halodenitrificans TaxID=1482 RepID=UPI001FB40C71|nr:helix-turn-helix transcriptional regulator [Virgibacillus halodenitrificans]MCJ0932963.1 helix-turn-helix transcriptional regulator [Virgibacillus halodenitrificans]
MRKKMRERRESLELSQQAVADRAGLTRVNYSSIERGRTEPNIQQMVSIANVLKVKPNVNFFKDFCDDMEQKSKKQII